MGVALCLVSAVLFGALGVFGKLAFDAGVTLDVLLVLRFGLAAVVLAVLLVVRPDLRRGPARPAGRRPARLLLTALALGAVGYAMQAALYFGALTRIGASLTALMLYTYPLLVTLAAVALGRERLTAGRATAVVVACAGTVLVLVGAGALRFDALGVAMGLGSAVTYTVYILVSDTVVHRLAPVLLSAVVMTGATLSLGALAVAGGGLDLGFDPVGWVWIACIALVSTVGAVLAFFAGLRRTGASTASILSTLEPVVTTALAGLVLGEFLTPLQLAGATLVLSAVVVVQLRPGIRWFTWRPVLPPRRAGGTS